MNDRFWVVVGMSIAYLASFMGLIFAWIHYKRKKSGARESSTDERRS